VDSAGKGKGGVHVAECLRPVTARTSLDGSDSEWLEQANLRDLPLHGHAAIESVEIMAKS